MIRNYNIWSFRKWAVYTFNHEIKTKNTNTPTPNYKEFERVFL